MYPKVYSQSHVVYNSFAAGHLLCVALKLSKVNGEKILIGFSKLCIRAVSFQILCAVPTMQANLIYSC